MKPEEEDIDCDALIKKVNCNFCYWLYDLIIYLIIKSYSNELNWEKLVKKCILWIIMLKDSMLTIDTYKATESAQPITGHIKPLQNAQSLTITMNEISLV